MGGTGVIDNFLGVFTSYIDSGFGLLGGEVGFIATTLIVIDVTLAAHGYSMSDLIKCTVMLADMSEWGTFNDIYKGSFDGRYPARSALGANGLALGARVEVECIAAAR